MNCEETESVNDEIQSQEFFDKEIQENVQRGEKLIGRVKKFIPIIIKTEILLFFILIIGYCFGSDFLLGLFFIAYPLHSLFVFFVLLSSLAIYCKWLYRILSNLRKFTETRFSFLFLFACSLLPGIGQILTCFIFKDILTHQKEILDTHSVNTTSIPTTTPLSPLLLGLGTLLTLLMYTLGANSYMVEFIFLALFFPIIIYLFIFKVAFDIFAIIVLLIYMKLIQQPLSKKTAIALLNIKKKKTKNSNSLNWRLTLITLFK